MNILRNLFSKKTYDYMSLVNDIGDYDGEVRQKAVKGASRMKEEDIPKATEYLISKLENSHEGIQQDARDALGNIGELAIPFLISYIDRTRFDDTRRYAKEALSKIKARQR